MAYTDIDDPSAYFQTALYTGDNANTKAITFDGNSDLDLSSGGLWWGKTRSTARNHNLVDSIRGVTKTLESNTTGAERSSDSSGFLASFNSNGFTTQKGSYDNGNVNMSGRTYVNWCWKETEDAGFDIVSYTGNATARTISHSLSAVPAWMIIKCRSEDGHSWKVYHKSIGATGALSLQNTGATDTDSNYFNDTAPTSSVFTVGSNGDVNDNGETFIAYLFAEKQGYSKFGSYVGNGNVNGSYIHLGFSPAFILGKRTDSSGGWWILDSKRPGFNLTDEYLLGNDAQAEDDDGSFATDFLSNGWKARATNGNFNASGGTYIFMAFASNPFVTSTGVPATAR